MSFRIHYSRNVVRAVIAALWFMGATACHRKAPTGENGIINSEAKFFDENLGNCSMPGPEDEGGILDESHGCWLRHNYPETLYFDYDEYEITDYLAARLEKAIEYLSNHPDEKVCLRGYTDELGTTEYNYHLGMRRAATVRDFLIEHGISADRLIIQSKGEEWPAVEGHHEEAWMMNRRVEWLSFE